MAIAPPWDIELAPAIHEAGHAVMAHILGMKIDRVTVRKDGSGETVPDPFGSLALNRFESAVREIRIALAGPAAETRYCVLVGYPDNPDHHPDASNDHDTRRARRAAMGVSSDDEMRAFSLIDSLRAQVDEATGPNWDVIVRCGFAIVQHETVRDPLLAQLLADTNGYSWVD